MDHGMRSRSVELNQLPFAEYLHWRHLFHFGLPAFGWVMLIIEIIPTFFYFAIAHFHLRLNYRSTLRSCWWNLRSRPDPRVNWIHPVPQKLTYFKSIDYMIHFYAILASVPSVFLIAVLSDGYVYGKFIAAVIVLSLASLAGACSILTTMDSMDHEFNSIMMKISIFSVYFYFVAVPIRLTIFADMVSHKRNQPNARKCFTLFWVINLLGAACGLKIFKHYYDTSDPKTISNLTIALVVLTIIYFLCACIIAMTLPLQLQTTNLFIYHMRCFCFAIRQQPSFKNWEVLKPGQWLEVASKKFTWTEVKRTKSIYFLSLYIIPVTCYFDCQSLMYFYWYSTRFVFVLGGNFMDDYSFFYLHMGLTSVVSLMIQFAVLPILSYVIKNIKESWIFFAGYLFLGMSLILLLQAEIVCNFQNPNRYFKSTEVSLVRLINGYPHEISVLSEWNGKLVSIRPGELAHIKVNKENVQTFGETAIFRMPQFKMVDLIATTVGEKKFKNYLVRDGGFEVINVKGSIGMERTREKLGWIHRKFNATILILCSSELSEQYLTMHCYYVNPEQSVTMPTVEICRSQVDFSTGSAVRRTIPMEISYYPRKYTCRTSDGQVHLLDVEPKVIYLLYYIKNSSSTPKEFLLPKEFDSNGSSFVKTDLTIETCSMNQVLLVLQVLMHAISTSCMLVSANTMVCLYGPPRLRMISYAVLYVGVFTGMAVIRITIISNLQMIDLCTVHMGIYTFGLLLLFYNVLFVKFEMHSWEQPWRPSIFWKLFLCIRNWLLYKKFLSEKGPSVVSNEKTEKSILQSDADKDRRSEDDKTAKKVTFHQIEVDPSLLVKAGTETNNPGSSEVPHETSDPTETTADTPQPPTTGTPLQGTSPRTTPPNTSTPRKLPKEFPRK